MRKALAAAFAAATLVLFAQSAGPAAATPVVSTLGAARANAALVHEAAIVCGSNGCAPVQTARPRRKTHP